MAIIDAHLHLNGSVSLKYLKETADLNNCSEYYQNFILEDDPWKKFGWVHQIIKTTDDIARATIDVVENSTADILEIRTTPKAMQDQTEDTYIKTFSKSLFEAQELYPKKRVRGLLSIDRTRHSLEDAKRIIDAALREKQILGMIVGVDLSGNYLAQRKLTGDDIYEAIKYALSKDIGVALHVGEINTEIERTDFDIILKAIEEYQGDICGKIRLGHAIYRTESQDKIIKKRKIPVEICPSCHEQLGWWKQSESHSILNLYQSRSQVLPGTDDSLIFKCNAKEEQQKLDAMFISDKFSHLTDAEQHEVLAEKRIRFMF